MREQELIDGDPPRDQQKAVLRRAFGDMKWEVPEMLDRMDRVNDVYFDRVSQIHLTRWSTGQVLRFRGFFAPRTALALGVRNVAVSALSISFFANRLIGGLLQDELVLPDDLAT